ncbi:MAG: hypothetical protein IJR58_03025 [Lachnospiraceae bacterium]|nr:hypothetical protein [Lachnospiraceae bacterium]
MFALARARHGHGTGNTTMAPATHLMYTVCMDINEVTGNRINRHPWELSRTGALLRELAPYIAPAHSYINVGAGDLFFDKTLLRRYPVQEVHAVDLGYEGRSPKSSRIRLYTRLEDVKGPADYALMMDSLEYMEDDLAYIKALADKVKPGGYCIFTLPAFSFLFSDHDRIVKNLRRYDRKDFHELIAQTASLHIVKEHYFYTSLFLVRFIQKFFHLSIDPEHKVTTGWKYGRRHPMTLLVQMVLDLDFTVNRFFGERRMHLPGLSLFVVCRK